MGFKAEVPGGPGHKYLHGKVTTDADGRFEILSLIPREKYNITVTSEKGASAIVVPELVAKSGETLELGDVIFDPKSQQTKIAKKQPEIFPAVVPVAYSLRKALSAEGTPLDRFDNDRRDAQFSRQHILMIFAGPANKTSEELYALTFDRQQLRDAVDNYRVMWIATDAERLPAAQSLAKKLKFDLQAGAGPSLVIADERGNLQVAKDAKDLFTDGKLDGDLLRQFTRDRGTEKARRKATNRRCLRSG